MTPDNLKELLHDVKTGTTTIDEAVGHLRHFPFQDLGCAQVDHHRELRQGMPEVIFGEGKTVEQIVRIMAAMAGSGSGILVTRLAADKAEKLSAFFPAACYHDEARCLTLAQRPPERAGRGKIIVVSAGTSDIPVASRGVGYRPFSG